MNKKLQRMLGLADIKSVNENNISSSNFEIIKEGSDDKIYAIVKENSKYFIKTSQKKPDLTENDFDYIGGIQNKSKSGYKSFQDATKKLNLIFNELNYVNDLKENVNVLESDLITEKKFILKTKKPKKTIEPDFDIPEPTNNDTSSEDMGDETSGEVDDTTDFNFDDTEDFDNADISGDEDVVVDDQEDGEGDNVKKIQRLTGKLGQKIRDTEDMTSDLQKWIAKSVLSALDLDTMDDSDKKDIINTIENESDDEDFDEDLGEDFDTTEDDEDSVIYDENVRGGEKYDRDELLFDGVEEISDDSVPCPHCSGQGYDEFTDETCEWCDGSGYMRDHYEDENFEDEEFNSGTEFGPGETYEEEDEYEEDELPENSNKMLSDRQKMNSTSEIELDTYEQELAFDRLTKMCQKHGYTLKLAHRNETDDIEESIVYFHILDKNEPIFEVRVNALGDMEMGDIGMDNGEPVDNLVDFDEVLDEDINNVDMLRNRDTKTAPTKPTTKPDVDQPTTPSRKNRPFTPPPHITPGEEPRPKAEIDDLEDDLSDDDYYDITFE